MGVGGTYSKKSINCTVEADEHTRCVRMPKSGTDDKVNSVHRV